MNAYLSAVMRLLTSLIALMLLLSSSGYSHSVKAGSAPVAGPGGGAGPSPSSREALEAFIRQLDRAETLYQALMFEEADRVSEMTVMRINAFLESHRHLSGINELESVLQARTNQLRELRSLKQFERQIEEDQAAARYDNLKIERERKRRELREHSYRMAVERRRAAEARAASWWPLWFGRPLILVY